LRRDHRPYILKKMYKRFEKWYVKHYMRPQFKRLGKNSQFLRPWNVSVFGWHVELGDYASVIGSKDQHIQLISWPPPKDLINIISQKDAGHKSDLERNNSQGEIKGAPLIIGKYALICPGVRIQAASGITIGDSCMMAQSAYITDADWHGIYNRCQSVGKTSPINIKDNVWIGDHAIVCKGVTIGQNSIIGAGSIVTKDIPPNVIAAGNPAVTVKKLDNNVRIKSRRAMFLGTDNLDIIFDALDLDVLKDNTFLGWIRHMLSPGEYD